jgi:hypothetical protein
MFPPQRRKSKVNPYGIGPFQLLQLFNRCAPFKFLQSQVRPNKYFSRDSVDLTSR